MAMAILEGLPESLLRKRGDIWRTPLSGIVGLTVLIERILHKYGASAAQCWSNKALRYQYLISALKSYVLYWWWQEAMLYDLEQNKVSSLCMHMQTSRYSVRTFTWRKSGFEPIFLFTFSFCWLKIQMCYWLLCESGAVMNAKWISSITKKIIWTNHSLICILGPREFFRCGHYGNGNTRIDFSLRTGLPTTCFCFFSWKFRVVAIGWS